jgi:acetoin utilization protein AcuB
VVISDVMSSNVVSISSTTSLAEARRIMDAHNIRRLPVVDRAVLVGIVTKDDLDKMGPSKLTTFSVNELVYLLNKISVKDVMHTDVVTVPPDATIEEVVATAQARKIGSVVIVESGRVIGIATTNDVFLGILNPLLGIGKKGSRICVVNCFKGPDVEKVISIINSKQVGITNIFISEFPKTQKHDLIVHLDDPDGANVVAQEIRKLGFMVVERRR